MDELAKKKYVKNKVRRTFINANVTISRLVINQLANELYVEFAKLPKTEQEELLFSNDLVITLTNKHVQTKKKKLMEEEYYS